MLERVFNLRSDKELMRIDEGSAAFAPAALKGTVWPDKNFCVVVIMRTSL